MTQTCPVCGRWVPDNEWAAFHRCEDCYNDRAVGAPSHCWIAAQDMAQLNSSVTARLASMPQEPRSRKEYR